MQENMLCINKIGDELNFTAEIEPSRLDTHFLFVITVTR